MKGEKKIGRKIHVQKYNKELFTSKQTYTILKDRQP